MNPIKAIKRIITTIKCLWRYRKPIWIGLTELDDMIRYCLMLDNAYSGGIKERDKGQEAVKKLVGLKTFTAMVAVTEETKDDTNLGMVREFVADDKIFTVAWRIIHGDWDVEIEASRWSKFISRIKRVFPFISDEELEALKSQDKAGIRRRWRRDDGVEVEEETLSEQGEIGVIEVTKIVVLILTVLPRIFSIINKNR